jgi:hypothetical protein
MTIRNRELSQFGSFIYVENSTQEIGITTGALPYVGIGTINPEYKLHVVGDTNIQGDFYINGEQAVSVGVDRWNDGDGDDIYRVVGNIGIGTTNPTEKLDVRGNVSANQFISTVSSGTAPFVINSDTQVTYLNASLLGGKSAPSGDIVGTTDTQTLSNKTLSTPTISGAINFGTATLSGPASGFHNLTLPAESGTLLTSSSGGIISGLVTTGNIQNGTILNEDIADNTIQNAKLANSTISGISLGNNLANLTAGSFISYSSGSTYNGSTAITIGINNVTTSNVNSATTIVGRDINGDFTAGTITATNFNTTSDLSVKENVSTVENALETISQLRGVNYTWKETQKPAIGVIAQELQKVLPQLVADGEIKSVNYNGLIGVLIEAVKELSAEVEELKKQIS